MVNSVIQRSSATFTGTGFAIARKYNVGTKLMQDLTDPYIQPYAAGVAINAASLFKAGLPGATNPTTPQSANTIATVAATGGLVGASSNSSLNFGTGPNVPVTNEIFMALTLKPASSGGGTSYTPLLGLGLSVSSCDYLIHSGSDGKTFGLLVNAGQTGQSQGNGQVNSPSGALGTAPGIVCVHYKVATGLLELWYAPLSATSLTKVTNTGGQTTRQASQQTNGTIMAIGFTDTASPANGATIYDGYIEDLTVSGRTGDVAAADIFARSKARGYV